MNQLILLVCTLQTPLLITNPILQILYKILFAYAYLLDYLKQSLTNFMNILTLV